jgi:hypothetical protein
MKITGQITNTPGSHTATVTTNGKSQPWRYAYAKQPP